jgi:hypothetical protein
MITTPGGLMDEKLDEARINGILLEFIREELAADRDIDAATDTLGPIITYERPDGGVNVRFHYYYNEEDSYASDYSAGVSFRGAMHIDSRGKVLSKSLEMAQKEIRASGPRNFLDRKDRERVNRRGEKERLIKWEEHLKIGDMVEARFYTLGGAYFEFFSEIASVNPKNFRVIPRGTQRINSDFEGKEVAVPRRLASRFSENNGVFPLDDDGAIDEG